MEYAILLVTDLSHPPFAIKTRAVEHADSYRWLVRDSRNASKKTSETLCFTSADWSHDTFLGSELERKDGLGSDR